MRTNLCRENLLTTYIDYCIAAFAVIIIISVFQWFVDGRKNFTGPRIDLGVDGLEVAPAHGTEEDARKA